MIFSVGSPKNIIEFPLSGLEILQGRKLDPEFLRNLLESPDTLADQLARPVILGVDVTFDEDLFLLIEKTPVLLITFGKTITSTVPTRSSSVTKAMGFPVRVYLTVFAVIIPPMICRDSSSTWLLFVSSSSWKSLVRAEMFFRHMVSYFSSGWPLI